MCGLSLAWVTSENSTMLLESDSSWLTLAGPYPMLPRLSAPVSGVDCPCPFFHANPLLFASLLSNRQLPSLLSSRNCPLLGRVVNCHSRPLTTSRYGEILCPRILCLVSRQNRLVLPLSFILLPLSFILNKLQHDLTTSKKKQEHLQEVKTEITKF